MTKRRGWHTAVRWRLTAIGGLSVAIFGCQPTTPAPAKTGTSQALPEFTGSLEDALDSDSCSTRMQEIGGLLARYCYNHKGQLPTGLDELKELQPGINLTCPVTGQPYVYSSAGLFLPNQTMRVILWEPTASHGGSRLCLLIPGIDPGTAVITYVKPIPERDFEKGLPPVQ